MPMTYDEMTTKWINGQRNEVVAALKAMGPIDAALSALSLVSRMSKEDAELLRRTLYFSA